MAEHMIAAGAARPIITTVISTITLVADPATTITITTASATDAVSNTFPGHGGDVETSCRRLGLPARASLPASARLPTTTPTPTQITTTTI